MVEESNFLVTVLVRNVQPQSVEDMQLNAQQYIKDDIEDDNLYIENIKEIK
tara:strand:+ start:4981 stop:5133 length:153 start_codon:yes stop_codon:yes gene_type:complete